MTEKEIILKVLRQVADGFVSFWGNRCEVAVHDLTILDKSLVYLAGAVTQRPLGSPITDLVLTALRQEGDGVEDLLNYRTITKDGRVLKSSTFFFRGKRGNVIGALCVNLDTTDFMNVLSCFESFVRRGEGRQGDRRETFAASVAETVGSLVEQIVSQTGKQPSTLSAQERVRFVEALEERGAFLIKGAVNEVATLTGVSRYSIYGHLKKIRTNRGSRTA
jgi:predicted transcriptional regulator YheO